jgi:1-acyl-sn-glycerol-3-phosphate acyltransferase
LSLRAVWRAVALGSALAFCVFRYWVIRLRGTLTLEQRAQWMQFAGRTVLARLGIRYRVHGSPPKSGIVVANHLSYLDIAVVSAAMKCFFVAKAEISTWPYFGATARFGGTLFLDRSSRASAERVAAEIAQRLALQVPILFFPEGTSTDGSSVFRFHTRLFEPAIRAGASVTAAAIRYVPADGAPEYELCWFGDESFLPNLWKVLGAPVFTAEVYFGEPRIYTDRKTAASQAREEVMAMRADSAGTLPIATTRIG